MNPSVSQPPGTRSSSTTFLKVLTVLSLALACGELLLTLHYRRELAAPEYPEDVAHAFEKVYYSSQVWHSSTKWLGITTQQAPTDNWEMQELICEIRPDYIIETGTLNGGTTLFYADVMSYVNPQGKVITIDIEPRVEEASKVPLWKQYVEMVVGSSVDPKVTDHVAQEV